MIRVSTRVFMAAGLVAAALLAGGGPARASHPDLFYNFYAGPAAYAGGAPGQMYVSPRPTPPRVGHTWITYQPLMPHEFTYKHHRNYYRYYPNGGWTSTHVCWW